MANWLSRRKPTKRVQSHGCKGTHLTPLERVAVMQAVSLKVNLLSAEISLWPGSKKEYPYSCNKKGPAWSWIGGQAGKHFPARFCVIAEKQITRCLCKQSKLQSIPPCDHSLNHLSVHWISCVATPWTPSQPQEEFTATQKHAAVLLFMLLCLWLMLSCPIQVIMRIPWLFLCAQEPSSGCFGLAPRN